MTFFLGVLYAGLAGTLLALIVATAQNKWSLRVFFLLALRLAIGWHFLFEGLHKVSTHYGPPAEGERRFSSEGYFRAAQGPLGPFMRQQFGDPLAVIADRVQPAKEISPTAFAALSPEDQAAACPPSVAAKLDAIPIEKVQESVRAEAAADEKAADAAKKKGLADAEAVIKEFHLEGKQAQDERDEVEKKAAKALDEAKKKAADAVKLAPFRVQSAKAQYARWVYGVDGRDTEVKFINGKASRTAPDRLAHIDRLRKMLQQEEAEQRAGLGRGMGIESKHAAELRTDLIAAENALAKDADAFVADLRVALGDDTKDEPVVTRGQRMDRFTMWFLVVLGSMIMLGFLTPLACVVAAGFLVLTYLTHPPFPWYPQPPNTEGNPLFVNKNVIEALALLLLACYPTGRWLGLDALLRRVCCGKTKTPATPATV